MLATIYTYTCLNKLGCIFKKDTKSAKFTV